MKKARILLVAALSLSLAVGLLGLTACGGGGGVAATVNGTEIMEDVITEKIEATRAQSEDYASDEGWASALAGSGLTPESLRETTINNLARDIIVTQEAESQGYSANDESIDDQIAQAKETVGGDEEAWQEALKQYNYKDEQAFRDMLVVSDLSTQLYDAFEVEPTDEELATYIGENPTAIEGWTYEGGYVEEAASEEVVDETATEEAADEALADEAATDEEVVDEAAAEEVPAEEETAAIDVDLSAVPEDIVTQYKELWIANNKGTKFNEWIDELVESADIVINDMPEDVSYNVDMSLAETDTDDTAETDDGSTEELASYSSEEAIAEAIAAGLVITDEALGEGETAHDGDTVRVMYTGTLEDGTVFDSNVESGEAFEFTLGVGSVIRGWDAGVVGMQAGGKRILTIPASLAYGDTDNGSIPAGSTLIFEVELVEVIHNHE